MHDDLQVGGTPDLIAPSVAGEEGPFVCDLKTGPATLKYGALKVAMQLAVYARSNLYDPETGRRQPHCARTNKGLVIALDSDTAQVGLHWVDLEAGWEAVQVCTRVREWRKRKNLLSDLDVDITPAPAPRPTAPDPQQQTVDAALHAAIAASPSREALLDLWGRSQNAWTDAHTAAAKQRLQQLTN